MHLGERRSVLTLPIRLLQKLTCRTIVLTSAVSWTSVFFLSYLAWLPYHRAQQDAKDRGVPRPLTATPPHIDITWYSEPNTDGRSDTSGTRTPRDGSATPSLAATRGTSPRGSDFSNARSPERPQRAAFRYYTALVWPAGLAFACIFIVGAPVAAASSDNRLLDAFVLWFIWILTVTIQRALKASNKFGRHVRSRNMIATMMNPVLVTTLMMVGYTRIKAKAADGRDLDAILRDFSAGSPLYDLWTAKTGEHELPHNPDGWFGAGDAALSLLECGILVWGFKLYECRRQLFSMAGVLTIVVSVVAAVGNVFLSVLAARAMGLREPEALAFAARSATLALAKPAIEAVKGNTVVNAALVVGNGILGQLVYPYALDALGVREEVAEEHRGRNHTRESDIEEKRHGEPCETSIEAQLGHDDPVTVAAGIAIGVNGAAMGVAYLYETRSRAAPYAAMSMTVFGVMTVILTTVGPFKTLVVNLAGG